MFLIFISEIFIRVFFIVLLDPFFLFCWCFFFLFSSCYFHLLSIFIYLQGGSNWAPAGANWTPQHCGPEPVLTQLQRTPVGQGYAGLDLLDPWCPETGRATVPPGATADWGEGGLGYPRQLNFNLTATVCTPARPRFRENKFLLILHI